MHKIYSAINDETGRGCTMTDEARPKRQRGRPPKSAELRKAENITIRMLGGLRGRVERAAAASGRSMSEEIAHRVEASFAADEARANTAKIITKLDGLNAWAQAITRLAARPPGQQTLHEIFAPLEASQPQTLRDPLAALNAPPSPAQALREALAAPSPTQPADVPASRMIQGETESAFDREPVFSLPPLRVGVHYCPRQGWTVTPVVTINNKLDNEAA